ncbi:MAG: methyltransferase domain-containing protein [Oscillospiraceae bacterium]|jgi:SAM-dependent methyltransferase|nr:methyltransferase domain-containing protein [Oscillospiraceae bacterium]
MYEGFAALYDALMDDVDYAGWVDYYLALMAYAGLHPARAAECACGTGSLTVGFARAGIAMTGVDASEDMLRLAGQKARAAGVRIPFICQDMRALALHRPVDAVLATCDGVNYLCSPAAVQAFLGAAYRALRPGGGLFFDVSSRYKLQTVLGDAFYGETREDMAYLWRNAYDGGRALLTMDLTFFVRRADGGYDRFDEVHRQRAHTQAELTQWLAQAGFVDIRIYGERTFEPPAPHAQRLHASALRP